MGKQSDAVKSLSGKRALVTGSSLGIGRAVAVRLAAEGAQVVLSARHNDTLEETVKLIRDAGGETVACVGSVADYGDAGDMVATCVDQFGGIDVLINCAGIAEPYGTSIVNIDETDWRELIDVHLHGTFNTCRHAAPLMVQQGGGTIINTSSHAFLGIYGGTGYAAGKGGVNSLSYAMATDLGEYGINVNVVCPGAQTRLSTGDEYEKKIVSLHAKGILSDERKQSALNPASPDYVASLYALLASDLARHVSGQVFWGSGGYIGRFLETGQEILTTLDPTSRPPWGIDKLAEALDMS
jgi:NAD(P)-dependent dehydrogenase (short-subunit alcohol dehydrogenase family)